MCIYHKQEMSFTTGTHVITAATPQQDTIAEGIIHIQGSCILNDHTMATFVPPLSRDLMVKRWQSFLSETTSGSRIIIVHISEIADRTYTHQDLKPPFPSSAETSASPLPDHWPTLSPTLEISGTITLSIPIHSQTGSFRGEVLNFFVHPLHRKRGVGASLMAELERQAWDRGRWNLMLDTTVGTSAEKVYERLGWTRLGVVPDYGYQPTGNGDEVKLADEVWFWKDLRKSHKSAPS